MSWWKVSLSNSSKAKHDQLQNEFEGLFRSSLQPNDVGLFGAMDAVNHNFYFSPGAAKIARELIVRYSGVTCSAPAKADVAALVAWANLDSVPFSPSN